MFGRIKGPPCVFTKNLSNCILSSSFSLLNSVFSLSRISFSALILSESTYIWLSSSARWSVTGGAKIFLRVCLGHVRPNVHKPAKNHKAMAIMTKRLYNGLGILELNLLWRIRRLNQSWLMEPTSCSSSPVTSVGFFSPFVKQHSSFEMKLVIASTSVMSSKR